MYSILYSEHKTVYTVLCSYPVPDGHNRRTKTTPFSFDDLTEARGEAHRCPIATPDTAPQRNELDYASCTDSAIRFTVPGTAVHTTTTQRAAATDRRRCQESRPRQRSSHPPRAPPSLNVAAKGCGIQSRNHRMMTSPVPRGKTLSPPARAFPHSWSETD